MENIEANTSEYQAAKITKSNLKKKNVQSPDLTKMLCLKVKPEKGKEFFAFFKNEEKREKYIKKNRLKCNITKIN